MYDAASAPETVAPLARAQGRLALSFRRRGEDTVLGTLYQQGCLKARLPRPEPGAWRGAVTLNTAGGVTGGDVLDSEIEWQDGAAATVASQAAERIYRADTFSGPARIRTHLRLRGAARAEWLPQETILFDGCTLDRRLRVEMAGDASFLGIESLVFGRAAMGETLRRATIADRWQILRDGRPILDDRIRLSGDVAELLSRPAVARGGRAVATLVHVAPNAEARCGAVRDALADVPAEAGASAWDGMLIARFVAADGARLRRATTAALAALRDGRPLPRVWLC